MNLILTMSLTRVSVYYANSEETQCEYVVSRLLMRTNAWEEQAKSVAPQNVQGARRFPRMFLNSSFNH